MNRPEPFVPLVAEPTVGMALSIRGLSKSYGATHALRALSLDVAPGEFVVLLGPSGAGKSTVFRCVTGLTRPTAGRVLVHDHAMHRLTGQALRRARRDIGLIFQQFNLVGRLSALDNVLAGRLGYVPAWRVALRRFPQSDRQAALANLDRVGLLKQAYQRADSLSGGQQQRVAIARVLTQQSRLLLADEPVSSLDPEAANITLRLLRRLCREQGIGVLCSLHQLELARQFADRIVGMRAGAVVLDGAPDRFATGELEALYVDAHATPSGDLSDGRDGPAA
ncbi:MAG: phosphonate ABC transporter ATP-binding protein [Alkalilacustris sp.]